MYYIIDFILTLLENREDRKIQKRKAKIKKRVNARRALKSRFKDSIII